MEISRLDNNTWMFFEGGKRGVRFFLLTGDDRALLIDSGMHTHNAKKLAREYTDLPLSLINTHADPDHIGSNGEFERFYMHPAEYINYYKLQKGVGSITPVWDGDVLELGGRPLRVIHIPGHTPGSIAVLDEKNRRLFSGDPVIQDGRIFIFGAQRELHAYVHSLRRLEGISGRFDLIYPSHGACPVKPELISKLADAAQDILDGKAPRVAGEIFGKPMDYYDIGPAIFLYDDGKE